MAAGIDIHNHRRTGSPGLEDVWRTKSYIHCQFARITGFIFTNAFLAINYFNNIKVNIIGLLSMQTSFKMKLANQLISYKGSATTLAKCAHSVGADIGLHRMMKLNDEGQKQSRCFYCMHGRIQVSENKLVLQKVRGN